MRKYQIFTIAFLAMSMVGIFFCSQVEAAEQVERSAVLVSKDLEYSSVAGESLKLDLYQPKPAANQPTHPGIVFIHGGGWSGGDKGEFTGNAKEMAEHGYVAITINYRLSPKHRFPAAVQDCQKAVRWLRDHAETYHVDTKRIGSMGSSAGGHLASMLGVRDSYSSDTKQDAPSSRVNCVVDYYGRMDLTMLQGGHDYRADFIGKTLPDGLEIYQDASPVFHVDKSTVPFLIVQGAKDGQVDPAQSRRMFDALEKAGIETSIFILGGQGHGFSGKQAQIAWDAAKSFLDSHLMK